MAVKQIEAVPLARVGATLGEGPVWVARDRALWFVDIKAPRVHRLDPATGRLDGWTAPDQVGWVLPAAGGDFLVGVARTLQLFSPADGAFRVLHDLADEPAGNRLNDAAIDPAGRLWFGTMDDAEQAPTGRVYVLDGGSVRASGLPPVVIPNGPAISPDGRLLYAIDTHGQRIDAVALGTDGRLGERRPFVTIDPALGHPDGGICDAEGGVWQAFYGGWAARRYAPDGTQTHEVRFPTANVTKIALGGADGRTAWATTARKGLDAAALAAQMHAGDVFTFRVDVPGVEVVPLALG